MTNTPHLTARSPAVIEFADGRETSSEIIAVIFNMAGGAGAEAQRLWEAPTAAEEAAILSAAWEMADANEDTLFWGGTRRRPASHGG